MSYSYSVGNISSKSSAVAKEILYSASLNKFTEALLHNFEISEGDLYEICVYKNWLSNQRTHICLTHEGFYLDLKPSLKPKAKEEILEIKPAKNWSIISTKGGFWDKFNIKGLA